MKLTYASYLGVNSRRLQGSWGPKKYIGSNVPK